MSARGSGTVARGRRPRVDGLSELRRHFRLDRTPWYFVSATNFNVLDLDAWVGNLRFVTYIDCFDGLHPRCVVPRQLPHDTFRSLEAMVNWLLQHKDVADLVRARGPGGKALFLFFDETTEALCRDLGLEVCFPPARLRTWVDHKANTTRIGNRAGVRSVPHRLGKVDSWRRLDRLRSRLGRHLVVQTPFGDSGHTTFFVSSRKDFDEHADEIVSEPEVKVMRRIRCRGSAIEACVTRRGTIVGPLLTELIGFPELTPWRGGWCGNEVGPDLFHPREVAAARRATQRFGEALRREGYRGYFELDFLTDLDTGRLYLGECNPRVTGASPMTNLSVLAHADAPLLLFHLLEWSGVDARIDPDEVNARWAPPGRLDAWAQMVLKHTSKAIDRVTRSPAAGVWRVEPGGGIAYARAATDPRGIEGEEEAFFLPIAKPGDWRYEGADLGILLARGRLLDARDRLTPRALAWNEGLRARFEARAPEAPEAPPVQVGRFKIL